MSGRGSAGLRPPVNDPDGGLDEVGLLDDLVEEAGPRASWALIRRTP